MVRSAYPTTEQLMAGQRARRNLLLFALLATLFLVFGAMGGLSYLLPHLSAAAVAVIGVALFVCVALPVLIWQEPRRGLYLLLTGGFLFEVDPRGLNPIPPTARFPFTLNLNNIGEIYGTQALAPLKFSPAEVIVVLTFLAWIVRSVAIRDFQFRRGAFLGWLLAYIAAVSMGWLHGIATGGDITMAIWEVRAQFLFLAAYLLGANLITERRHVTPILWIAAFCIGFKGLVGVYLYQSIGGRVGVEGMMEHEESLLFNVLFFVLIIGWMASIDRRLIWTSLLLAPACLFSALANQRRAGIAAFVIAFLPLLPLLWTVLEERRAQIGRFGLTFAVCSLLYLPVAWNGKGVWALPARAVRSQFAPSDRDADSDYYRLAENADLKFTRDLSPWIGYGYGKRFLQPYKLPQVTTDFLAFLPHNSVLWIWMRIGHIGFFCFLMLLASIFLRGIHLLKATRDPILVTIGSLAVVMALMLFTVGKYDLAVVNYRIMLITGSLIGILAVLDRLDPATRRTVSSRAPEPEADLEALPQPIAI